MPKKPKTQKQPAEVIGDAETMRLATEQGCFPADDGKDRSLTFPGGRSSPSSSPCRRGRSDCLGHKGAALERTTGGSVRLVWNGSCSLSRRDSPCSFAMA
jgi:hypothetical protein